MYEKPTVEKFGTFRELTRLGIHGGSDGVSIFGPGTPAAPGCSTTLDGQTYDIRCPQPTAS